MTDLIEQINNFELRTGNKPGAILATEAIKNSLWEETLKMSKTFVDESEYPRGTTKIQGILILEPHEILVVKRI